MVFLLHITRSSRFFIFASSGHVSGHVVLIYCGTGWSETCLKEVCDDSKSPVFTRAGRRAWFVCSWRSCQVLTDYQHGRNPIPTGCHHGGKRAGRSAGFFRLAVCRDCCTCLLLFVSQVADKKRGDIIGDIDWRCVNLHLSCIALCFALWTNANHMSLQIYVWLMPYCKSSDRCLPVFVVCIICRLEKWGRIYGFSWVNTVDFHLTDETL